MSESTNLIVSAEEAATVAPMKAKAPRPESTLRILGGLIVIWACLWMVFMAHHLSESYIRLEAPGNHRLSEDQTLLRALAPNVKLLLPFSMYARGTSPLQALSNVAEHVGLKLEAQTLARFRELINDEPIRIHFEQTPLYQVFHDLLSSPKLGFAIKGDQFIIFRQILELNGSAEADQMVDWKARFELTSQPILIVPTGVTDLWFSIQLTGSLDTPSSQWRTIRVEVWKGTEWLALARALLDDQGHALLNLSTRDTISFEIQRIEPAEDDQPTLYQLGCLYERFD